jgi:peptide/nickel transport system substrate-binding protein
MSRKKKAVSLAALAVAGTMLLAACTSSSKTTTTPKASSSNANGSDTNVAAAFNAATTGVVGKTTKTGGTLKLLANGDCDSWDPANTYYAWCWNMQRLFTRTLVGYSSIPGANNVKIEPDMATALGEHNADFTQWTYKLKSGLKYENGNPITTADIKYGIERLFATDVISGGPNSYYLASIDAPAGYKGVYKGGDLASILTPDANTITFKLKVPYADFDYLMSLPAAAPVPAKVEGGPGFVGDKYTLHPVSSGPYKIESYTPNKQISFVRNTNWDQATDSIRKPLADKIVLTIDTDPDDEDKQLQSGQADAEADGGVQSTFQSAISTTPDLKKNADNPVTGFTRYLVVFQTVKPLDNAIFYAINKSDIRRARGGTYGGDIANTMSPPILGGYDSAANPFPTGADSTGDLAKAKSELAACGQPNGFSIKEAYVNKGRGTSVFEATQVALARVGIKVVSAPGDQSTYYSKFIGSPANIVSAGLGIGQAGWGADFPTPYGFWNSITNGKDILPTGNTNYASLNDPVVNGILDGATTGKSTADDFKKLDAQVMKDAVMLPYVYDKTLFYRNPRMTNVRVNFALGGYYDFVNAGTADGK